jgi:hypothetical protein
MGMDINPLGSPFDMVGNTSVSVPTGDLIGDAVVSVSGGADAILNASDTTLAFNLSSDTAGAGEFKVALTAETDGLLALVTQTDVDHNSITNTHNLSTDIDHNYLTNTHNLTTNIDHSSITGTHNLTTDIDHSSITGAHNLTTDIDHNSITNTHNLTTDIDHDSITNTHQGVGTGDSPTFAGQTITGYSGYGFYTAGVLSAVSGILESVVEKTADYTITDSDGYTIIIASGVGTDITLPDISANIGRKLTIKRNDAANNITIKRYGTDPIDGTAADYLIDYNFIAITLVANASGWWIV